LVGPPFCNRGLPYSILLYIILREIKRGQMSSFVDNLKLLGYLAGLLKVFKHFVQSLILFPENSLNFLEITSLGI